MCPGRKSRVGFCGGRGATKRPGLTGNAEGPLRAPSRQYPPAAPLRGRLRPCMSFVPPDPARSRPLTRGHPMHCTGGHGSGFTCGRATLKIIKFVRGRQSRCILHNQASCDRNRQLTIPEITLGKTSFAHDRQQTLQNRLRASGRRPTDPAHKLPDTSSLNKRTTQC